MQKNLSTASTSLFSHAMSQPLYPLLSRWLRHRLSWRPAFRAAFNVTCLDKITMAISQAETVCGAEFRFITEESLPSSYLWRSLPARARALTLFGKHRVWDTEGNVGVLIYVLWAERKIEIVADRAAARAVPQAQWQAWVKAAELHFLQKNFAAGIEALCQNMAAGLATSIPFDANTAGQMPNTAELV